MSNIAVRGPSKSAKAVLTPMFRTKERKMSIVSRNHFLVPLATIMTTAIALPAAQAATSGDISHTQVMNSSPLWADTKSYHACTVANVTTSAESVSIEIIESDGAVLATSGSTDITVAAGGSVEIAAGATYTGFARCRVTTYEGANTLRANLTVFHSNGDGTYVTYAVSEVR
jgi:hypothetical protein